MSTEEIREGYIAKEDGPDHLGYFVRRADEFDRWYAEEIRKAKEEAWREGVATPVSSWPDNPYAKDAS